MSELPEGWEATQLGDLSSDISYGFTTSAAPANDLPKFLRITDVQDYSVDWETVPNCSDEPGERFYLESGDIVIARTGATTGKSFLVNQCPYPTVFASYLIRVRPSKGVDPEYLWKFMQSPWYWKQITKVSKGTAQPGANASILSKLDFPLPPLAEQRRIVEQLDQLSARTRAAKDHLAHVQTLATRAKQATLAAAFRGDLTASLEDEETVELTNGLPAEYAGRTFPKTWTVGTVGTFSENHDARRVPIKKADRARRQGSYPYYGASGVIDSFDEFIFEGRHLLVAEDGANLLSRSTAIAFTADGQFWVNNHAHILKIEDKSDHDYLRLYLESIALDPFVTGSAQPKLTQRALSKIGIVLPPKDIRAEIVRRIEAAFARIDRMVAEAARAAELLERLEAQLLAKAFRGELVPQNPADEPASALLARVREARAKAPKPKRTRKRAKT
jgi:type I restriction enzyme S subunit